MAGTGNVVFIEDGRYVCSHPYWPMDSLIDGGFDISQNDFHVEDVLMFNCVGSTRPSRAANDRGLFSPSHSK